MAIKRDGDKPISTAFFAASELLRALTQAINNDQQFTVEVSEKGKGRPEYQMLVRIFPTKGRDR
jgi:hypothetical protein